MKYDSENAQLELRQEELAGAVSVLGLAPGPLAPGRLGVTSPDAGRAFEDALASLPDAGRDLLESVLAVLADPDRSLKVAAISGESWLQRAMYAWRDGACVMLGTRAGASVLAHAEPADVSAAIVTPMLGGTAAADVNALPDLEGRAVLAFVGASDALRYGRIAALASHAPVPQSITAADVSARLADSMVEDPRWSTNLFASVLPFDASRFMDGPTVELHLGRLARAGLFGVTERDGAFPAAYHPTDEGLVALDTVANADGRVAFTLFEKRADALAYESMLLARGPLMTIALSLSPDGGGIAPTTAAGVTALAGRVAGA